jgi:hypothetical protein
LQIAPLASPFAILHHHQSSIQHAGLAFAFLFVSFEDQFNGSVALYGGCNIGHTVTTENDANEIFRSGIA